MNGWRVPRDANLQVTKLDLDLCQVRVVVQQGPGPSSRLHASSPTVRLVSRSLRASDQSSLESENRSPVSPSSSWRARAAPAAFGANSWTKPSSSRMTVKSASSASASGHSPREKSPQRREMSKKSSSRKRSWYDTSEISVLPPGQPGQVAFVGAEEPSAHRPGDAAALVPPGEVELLPWRGCRRCHPPPPPRRRSACRGARKASGGLVMMLMTPLKALAP